TSSERPNASQSPHQIRSRSSSHTSKLVWSRPVSVGRGRQSCSAGCSQKSVVGSMARSVVLLPREFERPFNAGFQSIRRTEKKWKAAGGSAQEPGGRDLPD